MLRIQVDWHGVQLQARLEAASAAKKPMVIDEYNAKRPIPRRNAFLLQFVGLVDYAGSPVVGEAPASAMS